MTGIPDRMAVVLESSAKAIRRVKRIRMERDDAQAASATIPANIRNTGIQIRRRKYISPTPTDYSYFYGFGGL